MKRFASLLLALAILFSMALPAFAEETSKITINAGNSVTSLKDRSFAAYKLMDAEKIQITENGQTVDSYLYTVADAWVDFFCSYWQVDEVDAEGNATVNKVNKFDKTAHDFSVLVAKEIDTMADNSEDLFKFARAALAYAEKNNLTATATKTADSVESVVFDNLAMGYYLIADTTNANTLASGSLNNDGKSEAVSALMLGTTDIEVTIKSDVTEVEKTIIEGSREVKYTNGAIGDCVNFKIVTAVPDLLGYEEYTFTIEDFMSTGLTYNENASCTTCQEGRTATAHDHSMVVKVGNLTLTRVTDLTDYDPTTATTGYKVYTFKTEAATDDDAGKTKITIDFPYIYEAFNNGTWKKDDVITVTYFALIDQNAEFFETGVPNEVQVIYSNDPTEFGDGDNDDDDDDKHPQGTTPRDTVEVFYGEINLLKVDESKNTLAGAVFELTGEGLNQSWVTDYYYVVDENGTWYKLLDGTFTEEAPTTDTEANYDIARKYALKNTSHLVTTGTTDTKITAEVGTDGKLKFSGLKAGAYVLTETVAPAGHNKLDTPIYVKLVMEIPTETNGDYTTTWKLYKGSKNGDVITYEDAPLTNLTVEVENKTGLELPSTGGMGTTLFYVVGAGLMLAAIVLLVAKKRAAN